MPRFIIKLEEGKKKWYMEWSTIEGAPVTYGMTLAKFKRYYKDEYGRSGLEDLEGRLKRVEEKGTSSHMHESAEATMRINRAGKNGTNLTTQQIIDYYCKLPLFDKEEDYEEYKKNKPEGTKWREDD